MKMIAALRNQFGGHPVTAAAGSVQKGADAPGADALQGHSADALQGHAADVAAERGTGGN
jgi:hypothetical protein